MVARMTRPWCFTEHAFPTALIGRVVKIRPSLAKLFFAMRCAEPVGIASTKRQWHVDPTRAMAETRIRIAGRWHRLCLELDTEILARCAFFRPAY